VNPGIVNIIRLTIYNTALSTLVGNGANLLVGGTASSAELRTQNNASQLGTQVGNLRIPQNAPIFPLADDWSFELGAGEGVLVVGDVDIETRVIYQWIEI
jgi:hypothetical protein